nr:MAG TPA: Protein IcmQ [Caudoviricetes sp.]
MRGSRGKYPEKSNFLKIIRRTYSLISCESMSSS